MLELNLDTMAVDADAPPQEALDNGAPPVVHVQVVGGSALPVADPNNPGRPLVFPAIVVNYPLTKDAALKYAEKIKEEAEKLPDAMPSSSKLAVASNMNQAEQMAKATEQFRKG